MSDEKYEIRKLWLVSDHGADGRVFPGTPKRVFDDEAEAKRWANPRWGHAAQEVVMVVKGPPGRNGFNVLGQLVPLGRSLAIFDEWEYAFRSSKAECRKASASYLGQARFVADEIARMGNRPGFKKRLDWLMERAREWARWALRKGRSQ